MLYPFIYTRTKFHDYRVVTSKSLSELSHKIVHLATEIARTLIDADNNQLINPTWTLVKKDGFILWGIAIVNKELGIQSQDKYNRPVRGFFGFISDTSLTKLPYDISYFNELYEKYVLPIWDSYEQTEQVLGNVPTISGFNFIEKSLLLNNDINTEDDLCRIFPFTHDSKSLIEAVLSSSKDCSIATNIHKKKQCVKFGKDKISFTNAVAAPDLKIKKIKDVKVSVPKGTPNIIHDTQTEDYNNVKVESFCSICGRPVNETENVCTDCEKKQQNKKYIEYGLYGFMALTCLLLIFNGDSIWKKIIPSKHSKEYTISEYEGPESKKGENNNYSPFLKINKTNITVQDVTPEDVYNIRYESSSAITQVTSPNNWIKILTQPQQYTKSGIIKFACEPLSHGNRKGTIRLVNSDRIQVDISIYQIVVGNVEKDEGDPSMGSNDGDKSSTPQSVTIKVPAVDPSVSGNVDNTGSTTSVESYKH